MNDLRLSFSGASSWLACRRKWEFTYQEKIKRRDIGYPLQVGGVLHELVHKYYMCELTPEDISNLDEYVAKKYPDQTMEVSHQVATEAATLLNGYLHKFQDDPLTVISSEMKIEIERVEPLTGKKYRIYGIIDAVCRTRDQRLWRLEHKTSARLDTFYLRGLRSGLQGGIYHHLLNETMPEPVIGTIYNMFVKTRIPQYERMPVLMEGKLAERSIQTFDGVARQIFEGDIFPDAGSCFTYNRECEFLPLCNLGWSGTWDERSLRIKNSFYQEREERR
jgi:hypothetical protein